MEYMWIRHELKSNATSKKEPTFPEISVKLSTKIRDIWLRASIPTVTTTRVVQLIHFHHDKYLKLVRYPLVKRNAGYEARTTDFKEEAKASLFDIASCKCLTFSSCTCDKAMKVPLPEQQFLQDQRTKRKMMIGPVDGPATKALVNKEFRKARERDLQEKHKVEFQASDAATFSASIAVDESPSSSDSDRDEAGYKCKKYRLTSSQQRRNLPNVAKASDRYAISDRAVAEITSGVLQDYGIITPDECREVIDRNKIRRERKKYRSCVQAGSANMTVSVDPFGIYFDGRKDRTLVHENVNGKLHRRVKVEEHVSLVLEPGTSFLGHVTTLTGSSANMKESIMNFVQENSMNTDNLIAIGCDGTAVNTGKKGGAIRLIEEHVNRPLHWFVCLLHGNELPLRHLFEKLDGSTTGPRSFSGPVGKLLAKCETLPVAQFKKIECEFPALDIRDLSTDQQYLNDICLAVKSGHCDEALSNREPGRLVMSRWITLANRVLRLYVSTEEPCDALKIVAEFIMKVYAPMWFTIKSKPSCKDGAKHLWLTIHKSRYLSEPMRAIVDRVIQHNSYFAHPENLILAMLTDDRQHVRELGLRRILRARTCNQRNVCIRVFQIPPLNFEATDYTELIDWQTSFVTEPPATKSLSQSDLERFVCSKEAPVIDFPRFPCHTQAVERCVKAVTEASQTVVGQKSRDGFIRARNAARMIMPTFNTKIEYRTK